VYLFNRLITNLLITTQEILIILLVDKNISVPDISICVDSYIIGFGVNLGFPDVNVTNITGAVEAVMNYYK